MSDHTVKSLLEFVVANRNTRRETARVAAEVPAGERPWWNVQLASADTRYQGQLDAIEELPALLSHSPALRREWPYPSDESLAVFRSDLAERTRTPLLELDELAIERAAALLNGTPSNGTTTHVPRPGVEVRGREIESLPRWARVAFAARYVRRVWQMLPVVAPETSDAEAADIDAALALAEASAAAASPRPDTDDVARRVLDTALRINKTATQVNRSAKARLARMVRTTVGSAAGTAAQAVELGWAKASDAYAMVSQACHALSSESLLSQMRRDYDFLSHHADHRRWTDETPVGPEVLAQPSLRLVGLHVRNLRAIKQFDLPADGLGWAGAVPDLVLVGGVNGSGKSTLLRFIAAALELSRMTRSSRSMRRWPRRCRKLRKRG